MAIDWTRCYRGRTTLGRFVSKIDYRNASGCWEWTSAHDPEGYCEFHVLGRTHRAHRLMFELYYGPIPAGQQIDHICRNHGCVNPEHLEPVTQHENIMRGQGATALHAAATHCPQGHPYSGKNLYVAPSGARGCRTCNSAAVRKYNQKKGSVLA